MLNTDPLKAYSYDLIGNCWNFIIYNTFISLDWTHSLVDYFIFSFNFFQFNLKLNIKFSCITFVILILSLNIFNDTSKLDLHSPYQNVSVKFNNNQSKQLQYN